MCANNCNKLVDGFNLTQKIVLRLLLMGFIAVGAYAIFLHSATGGWVYLCVAILGQAFFVLPTLCSHCPYPHQFNDCLFLPAGLMRRLAKYRGPKISRGEVGLMGLTLLAVGVMPQYWLFKQPSLLALFWALLLPFLAYFPLHLCKQCRHFGCPSNRVKRELRSGSGPILTAPPE